MLKVQQQMEMMPALMEKIHTIKMGKGRRTVVRRAVRRLDSQVRITARDLNYFPLAYIVSNFLPYFILTKYVKKNIF